MKRLVLALVLLASMISTASAQTRYETIHGDILRKMEVMRAKRFFQDEPFLAPDPTPVQLLFDARHYEMDIAFNFSTGEVEGSVKVTLMSLVDSLYTIDLDADDVLTISSVSEIGGGPLPWTRPSDLVSITLSPGLAQGDSIEIEIVYAGNPDLAANPGLFLSDYAGTPVVYSLSEPWGARTWWPCKDYADDKATFELYLSVPSQFFAASNGNYLGYTEETKWSLPYRRYHWRENYPMTTYLASIAASEYVRLDDYYVYAPGETMPVTHYVYPALEAAAQEDLNVTVPMLEFCSNTFGLYPFIDEKYGIACANFDGAMEHQTLTSYGYRLISGDHLYDWIFVHELAHQWFGDLITCKDWTHIWLNEGFASYSEALWFEHLGGPSALRSYLESQDTPSSWHGPVLRDPNNNNPWYYFDNVVYDKGSWVLHMLRHIVGDGTFFDILKSYVADPRYRHGAAETDDFVGICESHYGASLGWYFDEWLTREDRLQYQWSWNFYPQAGSFNLSIAVDQLQNDPYTMPVDFRVTTGAGTIDTIFWVGEPHEEFHIILDDLVLSVEFDPDHWILCDKFLISTGTETVPSIAFLEQNYPNPFNPITRIRFGLEQPSQVLLQVFDVRGTLVKTLAEMYLSDDTYTVIWDGTNDSGEQAASGLYFYRLDTAGQVFTRKMLLLR